MKYYLYIITIKSTGKFYIGVTNNIERRQQQHFLHIKSMIEERFVRTKVTGKQLYIEVLDEVYPVVRKNWASLKSVVKNSYSFSIKYICDTPQMICKKETDLIRRHINNPLLLNLSKKSTYAKY